jgi:hypothetical protein
VFGFVFNCIGFVLALLSRNPRGAANYGREAAFDLEVANAERDAQEEYDRAHDNYRAAEYLHTQEEHDRAIMLIGRDGHGGCLHKTLTPRWDSAKDMGHEDRATSFSCEGCGETFTPEEAKALRVEASPG